MDELKAILRSLERIQEDPSSSGMPKDEVAERLEEFIKNAAFVVPKCSVCGSDRNVSVVRVGSIAGRWVCNCLCDISKPEYGDSPAEAAAAFGKSLDGKPEDR